MNEIFELKFYLLKVVSPRYPLKYRHNQVSYISSTLKVLKNISIQTSYPTYLVRFPNPLPKVRRGPCLASTPLSHPDSISSTPGVAQTGGASEVSKFGGVMAHLLRRTNRFTFGPNQPRFGHTHNTRDCSKHSGIA